VAGGAAAKARHPASRRTPAADRQLLGAGCGGTGRGTGGADVARCEGSLQQQLEISTLTVLHVINVPGARRRILDPIHQTDKALGGVDVAWLRGDHENRVDPFHRQHADETAKRAFALRLEHLLELAGELRGIAVAHREECVGLPSQDVDVERTHKTGQGLTDRRIAADQQRVTSRIGGDLAALGNIGLEHFGEVPGGSIAQWHDLGACADRVRTGQRVGRVAGGDWHDRVNPVALDQGRTVCVEQSLERGQQCRARQWRAGIYRAGAVHIGVDRIVQL